MTILEFDHPLTHNVKARDPVGSKNILTLDDPYLKIPNLEAGIHNH